MSDYGLTVLASAIDDLNTLDVDGLTEGKAEALAHLFADVQVQRKRLHDIEAALESKVCQALPNGPTEWVDLAVEVRGGTVRKMWDVRLLLSRVMQAATTDKATGETAVEVDVAAGILDAFYDAAAVSYFRVGVLRRMGVAFDDAVEKEPGRRTVQVTRRGAGEAVA